MASETGIGAVRQAQRRRPLHHRQRPLHGRRERPRPSLRGVRALAPCAGEDQRAIDTASGRGNRRRGRRVHRRGLAGRRHRRPALRLAGEVQGRFRHGAAAAPAASPSSASNYVGEPYAVVDRRHLGSRQERRRSRAGGLRGAARRWWTWPAPLPPSGSTKQRPNNQCYDWELGDQAATDAAFENARHVVRACISSTTG